MEEIQKLETAVGKPVEQWNVDDINKFSLEENNELLQLLKNPDVVSECLERSSKTDKEVADILVPLYIKAQVSTAEKEANDILVKLEDDEIGKEEARADILKMLDNKSMYHHLVAYLLLISVFQDEDVSKYEIDIKTCIGSLKEIICGLTSTMLDTLYTLIMDLFELIFPLRSRYYEKYQVDILDDEDKRLENAMDSIHDYEKNIMIQLQSLMPDGEEKDLVAKEIEEITKSEETNNG